MFQADDFRLFPNGLVNLSHVLRDRLLHVAPRPDEVVVSYTSYIVIHGA